MVHGTLISTCILVSSIIMIFLAYKVVSILTRGINIVNALFFFMLNYVVFAYIGSVIFNVWYTPSCIGYGLYNRKDILLKIWIITSIGLFTIPLLTSMFYRVISFKSSKSIQKLNYSTTTNKAIKNEQTDKGMYNFCWILFLCCMPVFALYVDKMGGIPLLNFLKDRSLSAAFLRSEATNNFSGKIWRYALFYQDIPYILFILSCFFKKKGLFTTLLFYEIFISIMTFQKGPLINLVLLLLIIYAFKNKKLPFKLLFFSGLFCLLALIIMYTVFMGSKNISTALIGMIQRVFTGQIDPFFWYFRYVEQNGLIYGKSFPNPAGIFPFENIRITVEVMNMYYASIGLITKVVGSMPTVFMAEWYANFGYSGIFISILIFSFMLAMIDSLCVYNLNRKDSIYLSTLYIFLIKFFSDFTSTSFTGLIIDTHLYISVFLILFLYIVSKSKSFFRLILNIIDKESICQIKQF